MATQVESAIEKWKKAQQPGTNLVVTQGRGPYPAGTLTFPGASYLRRKAGAGSSALTPGEEASIFGAFGGDSSNSQLWQALGTAQQSKEMTGTFGPQWQQLSETAFQAQDIPAEQQTTGQQVALEAAGVTAQPTPEPSPTLAAVGEPGKELPFPQNQAQMAEYQASHTFEGGKWYEGKTGVAPTEKAPQTSADIQQKIQETKGQLEIKETILKEAQKMGFEEGEIPDEVVTKILQQKVGSIQEEISSKQAILEEAKAQGVDTGEIPESITGEAPTAPAEPTATPGGGTTAYENLLGGAGDLFQQYVNQISGALTGFGEQVEASQEAMKEAYAGVASAYTDIADALKNQPSMVEQYNTMMDEAKVPEMKSELARLQSRATQIEEQIETLPEDVKKRVQDFLMTQTQFNRVTAAEAEPLTKLYNALARASEAKAGEISATRAEVNDVLGLMQKDMDKTMAALQWGLEGAKSGADLEAKLSEMGIEYSQLALQTSMAMAGQALDIGMGELAFQRGLPGEQADIAYKEALTKQALEPAAGAKPTADIQEYQFAVSQGYQGTFEKWQSEGGGQNAQLKQLKSGEWAWISPDGAISGTGAFGSQTPDAPFLDVAWFRKIYGSVEQLEAATKDAGYGEDTETFLSDLMLKVAQYRKAGSSDLDILKLMQ